MKPTPFDKYLDDPKNWKCQLFYVCKDDQRIIVPKKPTWMGRTLNFAHPKSFFVLATTVLAVAIPFAFYQHMSEPIWWIAFLVVLGCIVAFYYNASLYQK